MLEIQEKMQDSTATMALTFTNSAQVNRIHVAIGCVKNPL